MAESMNLYSVLHLLIHSKEQLQQTLQQMILKVKNVAIYSDNSSDYSKGLAASFKKDFEAAGGKIVAEESYIAKDTDFRSTLTRIKAANPEFIFIPGYYEEVGLIVKQAREMGIDVPLMGADGWDSPILLN